MDQEELFEKLKSKIFKLENELKIKSEIENHLIYENESIFLENEKLIEESLKTKLLIEKLNVRIKKLEGDVDEIDCLKDQNEIFYNEIESLKNDLNKQLNEIKSLSKLPNVTYDSASYDAVINEYKQEIKHLKECNLELNNKIDYQSSEISKLKVNIGKEIEIWASKVENYKELWQTAKQEKDDVENDYLMFQTDVNQPDYKRQGNSLYVEVNDRRILVEMKLNEFQDELINSMNTNKILIKFLEDVFEEFSLIKEEEMLNIRQDFRNQIKDLTNENTSLKSKYRKVHTFFINEIEKSSMEYLTESLVLAGYTIENSILKNEKSKLEQSEHVLSIRAKEQKEINDRLYKINNRLYKENASLLSRNENLKSKLACFERIVPDHVKKEYEAKLLAMEETAQKKVDENPMSNIPPGIFGLRYVNATKNDHLVFDIEGRPIENRLTRRVLFKNGKEPPKPTKEVIPEPEYTYLKYVKQEDVSKQYASTKKEDVEQCQSVEKENIEPCKNSKENNASEGFVNASEQMPECTSS